MAEGSGAPESQEVQVIKPPAAQGEAASEATQAENELGATESLENDPDVVEHVDKVKVEAMVRKIGEFYDVPQLAIEQGSKAEIYIIKNEAFDKALEDEYKDELSEEQTKEIFELLGQLGAKSISEDEFDKRSAELNRKIEEGKGDSEKVRLAREHAEATGGVCVPREEGSAILIKENGPFDREHVETHEVIHAMSAGKNGEYGGFREGLFGGRDNNLNEAVTELLTLAVNEDPNITAKDMFEKVKDRSDVGYQSDVLKVLTMLHFTSQNEEPLTIKELAKYYFHGFQEEEHAAELFKNKLIETIRPDLCDKIMPWLLYDLNDAKPKTA